MEVDATWLESSQEPPHEQIPASRRALPPPLPPEPIDSPTPPPAMKAPPPPLAANSARHTTMPVEAQWLEVTEMDARLRASLAPLPPPDPKTRARMSAPIPRDEPDEPDAPDASATVPKAKTAKKSASGATKKTTKAARAKR